MQFDGAVVKEQGVIFAIVIVPSIGLKSSNLESRRKKFATVFGDMPIILAARNEMGGFDYHGREDIVEFLIDIPLSHIPWKRYTTT